MLLLFLLGCVASEPTFVSARDLDKALAGADTPSLCAGLRMKDDATRRAAAEKLKDYALDQSCLCDRLVYDGRWDAAILSGLAGGKDAAKVGCAGALLDDPKQPERPALVTALLRIPAVRPRLVTAAESDADPATRSAALAVFRNTKDAAEVARVEALLKDDADPALRAAAADALLGQDAAADALRTAATKDASPVVRGAALASYQSVHAADYGTVVCTALLEDPEPAVRLAALGAMHATRDPAQIACLKDRAARPEADPGVRATLLQTLASSASPDAAAALCQAIPAWVRTYVKDAAPAEGDDILHVQNERDFERSYDCLQAAVREAGGYTCAGRAYVGDFFRSLGGKTSVGCGGSKAAASNEVVF